MSNYPFVIDDDVSLPAVSNNITEIGGDAINATRDAIFAIENEIGIGASGSAGSIASRLGISLDAAGNIKPSAIASMGLVTLPIYNFHIAENAQILESKLKLDYRTHDLFNYIKDLAKDINNAVGWINITGIKLDPHIFGALYRHSLSHIDVGSSSDYLYNKFDLLRNNTNAYTLIKDINGEFKAHHKADGSFNSISNITTDSGKIFPSKYAHPATGIYLNTDRFSTIPQTAKDIQAFAQFIDDASIFLYGTRIQNFYSNGISRNSRSSSLSKDGYGASVVSITPVVSYLLNGLSSVPVDDIDAGDDIIEFKPTAGALASGIIDTQFNLVKSGDLLRINYGSLEATFIIKEKKYTHNGINRKFYVRINGKNLLATSNATARIDRSLSNSNKYGVLAVAAANNEFSALPSLIVGQPRGAVALGLGFNPSLLNNKHHLLYLSFFPTGHPTDGSIVLPGIDVTGNLGSTPGSYTLRSVVEATNDAFRKKGYNFRFIAFEYQGEFGIMLADPYNNAAFSIINGTIDITGQFNTVLTDLNFPNNAVGLFVDGAGRQPADPLGFGSNGSGAASPLYQLTYSSPEAANVPTKVFVPLKRNTYYVNGIEKETVNLDIGQSIDGYGDGYWIATITNRNIVAGNRVSTTYRILQNLTTSKLKIGKTIVVQSNGSGEFIDYGRFIIQNVSFDDCPATCITDIVVYDAIHAKGTTPFDSLGINSSVRIYFCSDSVGFNTETSTDTVAQPNTFKRHFEVLSDQNGDFFTNERTRFNVGGTNLFVNGILLFSSSNLTLFNVVKVSPKLKGYKLFSSNSTITKISLNIYNYDSVTGYYDGNLGLYNGSFMTRVGPTINGKIGEVVRFYDETHIDFIDLIFEFNGISGWTNTNNIMDIQLFPTLSLDKELFLIASCQVNESTNKVQYVKDERQFGNISEEEFTTSAIDFINSSDRLLHENGVIRGFDITNDAGNPIKEQIRLSGGIALVNGKLIQINNTVTAIPAIKEKILSNNFEYNVNWAVCVNDKSELQAIPLLDYDPVLGTPNNNARIFRARNLINGLEYIIDSLTFSSIINRRKDLCILYIVASTVTGSGNSILSVLSITDARKYVNDEGSNLPLKLTSDISQGNFRSPVAILNWIKFNGGFNSHAIVKGANTTITSALTLDFKNTVLIEGENNATLTFNAATTLGSNLTFKDLTLVFNQEFALTVAVQNLIFDHCTITITSSSTNLAIFDILSGNNIVFKDCTLFIKFTSTAPEDQFGPVFNILNSSNIKFINTSISGLANTPIFSSVKSQSDMFYVNNSPGMEITGSIFNGNFIKFMNIVDNSSNIKIKDSIITSTHIMANGEDQWSVTNLVNSYSGFIYSSVPSILSDIIIDNCTFNFSPAEKSSNRIPFISFELTSQGSVLKNLIIRDCKFNNTFTGDDVIVGGTDDKRPAICVVNTSSGGSSIGQQPLLINAEIVNNICNRNQSIILSSKTNGSVIMKYPGLNTVNCNIAGNICGTIGYWVSAGTRVNNIPTATDYNSKGSGLIIYNNDCHYIANLTGTGQYQQVSRAALGIIAASNTTPITITTSSPHGLAIGDNISISGVSVNSAANGNWIISNVTLTTFTLNNSNGMIYSSGTGGQINPLNLSAYPSGHVIISHNRANWIHSGIAYEENSSLTITKNVLNAFDTAYVGAFGHTASSNTGKTYFYAISVGANYYQSTEDVPGPSNDGNVQIEGNVINTGYYVDTNSQVVKYNYGGYINCLSSSSINNNVLKGVKEDISNSIGIYVGGISNYINHNKIYRGSNKILAYVRFDNYVSFSVGLTTTSYGNITDNYFDKPTIDNVVENLVNSIPDRWTYERNKNQTGFITVPLTDAKLYNPGIGSILHNGAWFYMIGVGNDLWASSMRDTPPTDPDAILHFRSNILRLYDNGSPDTRRVGWQQSISNFLPLNVKLIQIYSGVKPFTTSVETTSYFRLFLNKHKTANTFGSTYNATTPTAGIVSFPPIIMMDGLGATPDTTNTDTFGVENLLSDVIYGEATGGQINDIANITVPIYINVENVSNPHALTGMVSATGDNSNKYITGKGYDISISFSMYWKRNDGPKMQVAVAPVVVKYRW